MSISIRWIPSHRRLTFALAIALCLNLPARGQMKVRDQPDRFEAATDRYTLVVHKTPFRFEIRRGEATVLAAPEGGGGFLVTNAQTVPMKRLLSISQEGRTLNLRIKTARDDATVVYRIDFQPDRVHVHATVEGLQDVERIGESFTLASAGHWYGGAVTAAYQWPLETGEWNADPFLATSNHATPFWMASSGVGIFLNTHDDIAASINKGGDGLFHFAYLRSPRMHYSIFVGRNIAEARDLFVTSLGLPRQRPPDEVFERPVWSTWMSFLSDVTQHDVINLSRRIHSESWPASVIEIDEGWQTHFGDLEFNSKFPDPKSMVTGVHKLGYRLTLWVCNFANPDSERYKRGEERGLLVGDAATGKPARIHWWEGKGTLIDFNNPAARAEYVSDLRALMERYGVDGFKFDGGDAEYWPAAGAFSGGPMPLARNRYTDLWAEVGAEFELNELRVGWLSQPLGLFNRMRDKSASWSEVDGLPAVVTHGSIQSLLGFVFNCADLIGGGLDTGFKPDEELNVRWTQAAAFMPIMQFSYGPWNYSQASQKIIRRFVELHAKLWPSHFKPLVERAMTEGKPLWSPLFYVFPEDPRTYEISDEFMVGESLLVAPVLRPGERVRNVYLPAGNWRDFWSGETTSGGRVIHDIPAPLERIPVFERVH
jgi:alpha-glucosidase (family GH31 glycosyl hydrolase)